MIVTLLEQECCRCGVVFGIPRNLNENLLKTKNTFYCPNGHGQSYTESKADRLQREVDRKNTLIFEKDTEITDLKKKLEAKCKKKRK